MDDPPCLASHSDPLEHRPTSWGPTGFGQSSTDSGRFRRTQHVRNNDSSGALLGFRGVGLKVSLGTSGGCGFVVVMGSGDAGGVCRGFRRARRYGSVRGCARAAPRAADADATADAAPMAGGAMRVRQTSRPLGRCIDGGRRHTRRARASKIAPCASRIPSIARPLRHSWARLRPPIRRHHFRARVDHHARAPFGQTRVGLGISACLAKAWPQPMELQPPCWSWPLQPPHLPWPHYGLRPPHCGHPMGCGP